MIEDKSVFLKAIEALQLLKTTFSPLEKLLVIKTTFEQLTQVLHLKWHEKFICEYRIFSKIFISLFQALLNHLGSKHSWTMDVLLPLFNFVVIRAGILQLGSEINFIDDFMQPEHTDGELGIMFTTLKVRIQTI